MSVELMRLLTQLRCDVDITIRNHAFVGFQGIPGSARQFIMCGLVLEDCVVVKTIMHHFTVL